MLRVQEVCRDTAQFTTHHAIVMTVFAVAIYAFLAFLVWVVWRR